jgi:hypothetical protein
MCSNSIFALILSAMCINSFSNERGKQKSPSPSKSAASPSNRKNPKQLILFDRNEGHKGEKIEIFFTGNRLETASPHFCRKHANSEIVC